MEEFEQIYLDIERDLDEERCTATLPRLLELSVSNPVARTRAYLLAYRCHYMARNAEQSKAMFEKAQQTAEAGPIEAKVRVALVEASLLTSSSQGAESESKLEFAFEHIEEVSDDLKSRVLSIRGRNAAYSGNYVDSIEYSQEAIALSPVISAVAAYAHGTMALVLQTMGRIEESEQYGLEQIRISTEMGVKKVSQAPIHF